MLSEFAVYCGLFLVSFAAATILPMQSEAVLAGLLMADYRPWPVVTVASFGNVLGSAANWLLGRGVERFRHQRWFPVSAEKLDRAGAWYRRYGHWSLLLSWVPVIGDPLTVAAGIMKEPFLRFVIIVAVAKIGRYLAVAAITLNWS